MDAGEQKALADIEAYGCHIIHVLEEGDQPPFSYSVGVQKTSGKPEGIVVGLKRPIAHFVVNEYNRRTRAGDVIAPGCAYDGFLDGFSTQFVAVAVEHFAEYLGWNRWLYGGNDFSVLQLVYPTTDGVWPWDQAASASFRRWQPLLGSRVP
jgi:hypothetical protein